MRTYKGKTIYTSNYFLARIDYGLDPYQAFWNVMNRIDERLNEFHQYLLRLNDYGIIEKKSIYKIINEISKKLYNEIFLDAILAIEKIDLSKQYEEETKLKEEVKNKLQGIEEETLEELRHTMEPITFSPLKIEYVWHSTYQAKNKGAKRLQKKPGRPKSSAKAIV